MNEHTNPARGWAAVLLLLAMFFGGGSALLYLSRAPAHAQSNIVGPIQVVGSPAAEGSRVLKATPGYLVNLTVSIAAVNGWIMLFDATAVPADGAVVPRWCQAVVGNATLGGFNIPFPTPLRFPSSGIVVVFSSTGCFSKTASNAAFYAQVQ